MAADLPAILTRSLQRAAENGCAPRRVIIVANLPDAAPSGNERAVDSIHHLNLADMLDDPGVLGAVAHLAVRKPDA